MSAIVIKVPGTAGDPRRPYTYGLPNFGGHLYAGHVLASGLHVADGPTGPMTDLSGNGRDLDLYGPTIPAGGGVQPDGFYGSNAVFLVPPGNSRALYASGTPGEMTRVHFGHWPVSGGTYYQQFLDLDYGNAGSAGDGWATDVTYDCSFDSKINSAATAQEAVLAPPASYRDADPIMLAIRASSTSIRCSRGHGGGLYHGAAVARAADANPLIAGNATDGSGRIGQGGGATPSARLSAVLIYDIALTDVQLRDVLRWGTALGLAA